MENVIKEACVEGLSQALRAQSLGANRIELCAHLDLDGLTPSEEVIREAKRLLEIPIRVMIRPHNDGFVYNESDLAFMRKAIALCKEVKVEGVVFGFLNSQQEVDMALTQEFVQLAKPLKTVFHRAIESTQDIHQNIQKLLNQTNIDAILTSGGKGKAQDNLASLQKIKNKMNHQELVACGKISNKNIEEIHKILQAKAYHGKLIVGSLL